MRIIEIGTGYTPIPAQVAAATESVVEELTKSYIKMNQSVQILDISAQQRAEHNLPITEVKVPSFFTKSDVSLGIVHKLKRVVYSIALSFKLKKLLKNEKDKLVLHFHNQYNLFFFTKLVSKKLRSKAIIAYTNHNGYWSLPWDEVKDILHKRYFQEIVAMQNSDLIFALNPDTRNSIIKNLNISPEKVVEINNGVNTDIYYPLTAENKEKIKKELNLSGKRIILQVGSVYDNKGQARSVKMLAPLLKEKADLVYAYAGGIVSQEYFEEVKQTAANLGVEDKVIYLGSFAPGEEMNGIYNIADATVFNSKYEGFPLVCLESLSSGTSVFICSGNVRNFGNGCFICTKENAAEKLSDFLLADNHNFCDICSAARETAVNNYGWDKIALDCLNEFKKL